MTRTRTVVRVVRALRGVALGFVVSTAVALALAVPSFLAMSSRPSFWAAARGTLPVWWTWGLLTPAVWRIHRFVDRRASGWRAIVAHVPLSALFTATFLVLRALIERSFGKAAPVVSLAWLAGQGVWYIPTYWLILAVEVARNFREESRERELRNAQLAQHLSEARLLALRAQLNPHFLFNTLNAVSAFVERDPVVARALISDLGDLLRMALAWSDAPVIALEAELAFTKKYLAIQSVRHGDRLRASIEVPDGLAGAKVPTLLLQPIVENAIVHGLAPLERGGRLTIRAQPQGSHLRLEVLDDGVGPPPDFALGASAGVGLRNTAARLREQFGDDQRLQIEAGPGGGTRVTIELPLSFAEGAAT